MKISTLLVMSLASCAPLAPSVRTKVSSPPQEESVSPEIQALNNERHAFKAEMTRFSGLCNEASRLAKEFQVGAELYKLKNGKYPEGYSEMDLELRHLAERMTDEFPSSKRIDAVTEADLLGRRSDHTAQLVLELRATNRSFESELLNLRKSMGG